MKADYTIGKRESRPGKTHTGGKKQPLVPEKKFLELDEFDLKLEDDGIDTSGGVMLTTAEILDISEGTDS